MGSERWADVDDIEAFGLENTGRNAVLESLLLLSVNKLVLKRRR